MRPLWERPSAAIPDTAGQALAAEGRSYNAIHAGTGNNVEEIKVTNLSVSTFDPYIRRVSEYIAALQAAGHEKRCFDASGEPQALIDSLPITVGDGAFNGLILRKHTYAELGNPAAGSCAFPLWSNDCDMITDGRVTLVGPDIPDAQDGSLPFGQIVMVAGRQLGKSDQSELELKQYMSSQIEGYMIRSAPGRVWSRISREVAAKGLDFEMLGKALVAIFKQQIPHVEAAEVIFVTSSKADVEQLEQIATRVRDVGDQLMKEDWQERGFDPDACIEHDCTVCEEQETCDDIREVVQLQQKALKEQRALRRQQAKDGIVRKLRR